MSINRMQRTRYGLSTYNEASVGAPLVRELPVFAEAVRGIAVLYDGLVVPGASLHVAPVLYCDGPGARPCWLSLGQSARHSVDYACALLSRESQP